MKLRELIPIYNYDKKFGDFEYGSICDTEIVILCHVAEEDEKHI